jgi:hypothetical protein
MKKLVSLLAAAFLLQATACKPGAEVDPDRSQVSKGFASGKATDATGKPLAGAKIVVNNTQFYNHNLLGQTDAQGRYRIELTPGSWYVRGTAEVRFDTKRYVLDLHPDPDVAFAGTDGAVRHLNLKISGERTGEFGNDGYYGGQIEVFTEFGGEYIETEQVQLTLEPLGALVDGSVGKTLTRQPDRMYVDDVPLGKCKVTARYREGNRPLKVRVRNANQAYGSAVTASFDPAYAGAEGRYKLNVEVKR